VKHLRVRIHVSNLAEYIYDEKLSDKLVLNEDLKNLVETLVSHRDGGFRDIVKGKGGGAVVLLGGRPGVGKTLTAEVYAESKQRALYNVQCSQLGTDPDALEARLLKIFHRASRWNAVLLLDEADVYVRARGNDLYQNAIIGVFLRVLEYQTSVMFLATNLPDDVDDAILSRCVARLDYPLPTEEEQRRIWRILVDAAGTQISDQVIAALSKTKRTGRDVKNLLKLAMLVKRGAEGAAIDVATVSYVEKFRPKAREEDMQTK
jgi:SpoVK/Ycf46/Vps4 family AAA+-type ATPase